MRQENLFKIHLSKKNSYQQIVLLNNSKILLISNKIQELLEVLHLLYT